MKFVNFVRYGDLRRVAQARTAHTAYADGLRAEGKLAIGGPLMDDGGQRIGLLFIYEAASRDEAVTLAQRDPFTLADALAGYEISALSLRGVAPDLLAEAARTPSRNGHEGTQTRLFINYAKYGVDKSRLEAVRPAHWEYDRMLRSARKLAMAGALQDDKGGLFVYSTAFKEEAMSYVRQDPFALERVFASCEVLEWLVLGLAPALLAVDARH